MDTEEPAPDTSAQPSLIQLEKQVVDNTQDNSDLYKVFNGYLKYTDDLDIISNNSCRLHL